jgi:prephenate dehydrogenase
MKTGDTFSNVSDFAWIPASLSDARVAIWGIGLMGGSLAMSLQGKTAALYGIDPDEQVCRQAVGLKLFNRVNTQPAEILPQADLVILCAPLSLIPSLLKQLPKIHPGHAVVLDIGSTKNNILPLMVELPERFIPIGGHPMCGKEVRSLANACTDLYEGGSFALLRLSRTLPAVSKLVEALVRAVGAHPVWMDASEHDRWASVISALPFLAANCLSAVTPVEAAPLVGPGYKSTTRLAGESVDMMLHAVINNRENVLNDVRSFQSRLALIEKALETSDFERLRTLFEEGAARRSAVMEAFLQGGKS